MERGRIASQIRGDSLEVGRVAGARNGVFGGKILVDLTQLAFTGHAGELRVVTSGAVQVVYADTNGDRIADLAINVLSDHALTASDFAL